MADNITKLTPLEVGERFRFEPDEILEEAKGQPFTTICVLGQLEDGTIYVTDSANAGETMILLEKVKRRIVFGDE
jgi:hypothetical protein